MKKWLAGILLAAVMLLAAGCGSSEQVTADVTAMADGLKNTITFQDELTVLDSAKLTMMYPTLNPEDVTSSRVYVSSNATAEEIAAFEAKDADAAGRIREAVEKRLENQREGFADYAPAEMPKLNDPVLVVKGRYVVLCVSDDNGKAEAEIEKHWK